MQGVGSSSRNLLWGLALAVALHLLVFAIKLTKVHLINTPEPELNISIVMDAEPVELELAELEANAIDDIVSLEQSSRAKEPVPQVVTAAPEVEAKAQISISGQSFKQFLQSETERYIDANPSAIEKFADTFEPYYKTPLIEPETKYRDSAGPLGGGNYKVVRNGKVLCVLRYVPQTLDDFTNAYASVGAAEDCTPKQKFELNLRENTL